MRNRSSAIAAPYIKAGKWHTRRNQLPPTFARGAVVIAGPSNHRTQDRPSGHFLRIGVRATIASPNDPSR
jgi:hypothetical protein